MNRVWVFQNIPLSFLNHLAAKKVRTALGNPEDVDDEGLLADVDVQSIQDVASTSREDKRRDIVHFFSAPFSKVVDGNMKTYCTCKFCPYVCASSCPLTYANHSCRSKTTIVNQETTLRRHLESRHRVSLFPATNLLI